MAKPDGRIEKGQRLSTAISARAWNRAQDAADIVLGVRPGIEAGSLSSVTLPCLRGILPHKGYFGEVRVFDDEPGEIIPDSYYSTSMPATATSFSAEPDIVKSILNYTLPSTYRSTADGYTFEKAIRPFAICIGNDSMEYAISGLAFTRVRVVNRNHLFAKLPSPLYGYTGDAPDGCLDSAWSGPAKILGYVAQKDNELMITTYGLLHGVFFRWALVHF